jgi:hypothetical protein
MTQFRKQATGFAVVAGACVALTGTAFGIGGDDPFSSVTITSLPFADTGDTTTLTDQFDVVCPFTGSTSPDAWYNYTPGADMQLVVTLCNSAYDTKTYILDTGFNDLGCNDDACTSPGGGGFRSLLEAPVSGGSLVYIVVDGWLGDRGVYDLTIEGMDPPEPCEIMCDGADEGEPCDDSGATDTNGGCNSSPTPLFTEAACGDTVCGEAWGFGGTRDTDWINLAAGFAGTYAVTADAVTEFDNALFYLGENPDCGSVVVVEVFSTGFCEDASATVTVSGGANTWWFVGYFDFDGLPCGAPAPQGNDWSYSFSCTDDVPPAPCPALGDINQDGFVDFNDLLILLANYGDCP